ncbi:MAG: 4-(cytidine 5'-diphospho)-2-C-methyl-D-erythritol kinase [Curvibacter sp. GWA2_64_110]|nr:MAG: 4-(cytidine 5'-diphospho)-2-C-methyl-D-erythritol kinase [Curvibacter sp. GWA2_64_110]HCY16898.1 4-(cytidine 5'-diphospho)-2-C-methyl-D-erythritol kinase [Curvibacter sp.]
MKALYDIPAPAKLNLFLHITGRRADGYHLLQSAFMLIDWADTLHFELRPAGISREDLLQPLPADDLIVRAARALQAASGTGLGAHIAVEKRLPAQAGMGGGSSDAASTLLALNRLWQLNLSLEQLAAIGLKLGADVPFFLHGRHAWVEGIGEQITPLTLPHGQVLVVKPDSGLETRAIFSDPALKRDTIPAILSGFAADPYGFGHNDLQPVAQRLCPGVTQALDWLATLGLRGRMTGSGSAVFAWAPPSFSVPKAPDAMEARLCCSLDAHPLAGWATSDRVVGR